MKGNTRRYNRRMKRTNKVRWARVIHDIQSWGGDWDT